MGFCLVYQNLEEEFSPDPKSIACKRYRVVANTFLRPAYPQNGGTSIIEV